VARTLVEKGRPRDDLEGFRRVGRALRQAAQGEFARTSLQAEGSKSHPSDYVPSCSLQLVPESQRIQWAMHEVLSPQTWRKGRITLLGDSVRAPSLLAYRSRYAPDVDGCGIRGCRPTVRCLTTARARPWRSRTPTSWPVCSLDRSAIRRM
jgi:hypothetical protein